MRVGMRRDQRRFREARDIPKALFGDVREVDEDLHFVAGADELFTGRGQAVAGIGPAGKLERDAMAENVVPAPDRSERAQARRIQHLQKMQIAVDGFGAFEMKHHRQRSTLDRRMDLGGRLAKRDGALRSPDNPHQDRQLTGDGFPCLFDGKRSRKRHRILAARHLLAQRRKIAWRRRVHREQTADEGSGPGLFQVDMAGVFAIKEIGHHVAGFRLVKTQQNIVVAVENGDVGRHCLPVPVTDIASCDIACNFPQNRCMCNLYSSSVAALSSCERRSSAKSPGAALRYEAQPKASAKAGTAGTHSSTRCSGGTNPGQAHNSSQHHASIWSNA